MIEALLTIEGGKQLPLSLMGNTTLLETNAGTSLSGAMTAVYNDNLYVAGGLPAGGSTGNNIFRRYDLIKRTWHTLANLPIQCRAGSLLVSSGKIYLFGGYTINSTTYSNNLYVYDPLQNTWTFLSSSPNAGRGWFSGAVSRNKLYYFGGWNGTQLRLAEVYDTTTNQWNNITQLPETRHGHVSVGVGGAIYIFAGLTSGGGITNNNMYLYDPNSNNYTTIGNGTPPSVRCYSTILPYRSKLYIFGGYADGNGSDSRDDCWYLDLTDRYWHQLPLTGDVIGKRGVFASGIWQNELHILFGQSSGTGTNYTDHYIIT